MENEIPSRMFNLWDSLDVWILVCEYLVWPSDYFELRSCSKVHSGLSNRFPISVTHLLRFCSETRFLLSSEQCKKLFVYSTPTCTTLKRNQVDPLIHKLPAVGGDNLFSRILDLQAVEPFVLYDAALKLDREDIGLVCLDHMHTDDVLRTWRRLQAAVSRGYLRIVTSLVSRGIPVTTVEADADPLIHTAIVNDQRLIVRFLISQGADLSETDSDGLTPFLLACKEQRAGIVQDLIAHDRSLITQRDNEGRSCLIMALQTSSSSNTDPSLIDSLISNGAEYKTVVMPNGMLTTQFASALNRLDLVQLFVEHGVSLSQTDSQGRSSLDVCAMSFPMVSYLMSHGVPLNPSLDYLGKAAAHNELDTCIFLANSGVSIKQPETLIAAVSTTKPNKECVSFLLSLRPDVNIKQSNGESALYRAIVYRNVDACYLLLEAKADPETDFNGTSLLRIAQREGFGEIADLIDHTFRPILHSS